MNSMPIDLATVDWLYVVILALFVFLATLIAGILSFGRRFLGALLSAILFAAAFVFWTYYPHHLPLPTVLKMQTAAAPAVAGDTARSSRTGTAAKPGHRYYAARYRPAAYGAGITAGRASCALGLRLTVLLMFSHV